MGIFATMKHIRLSQLALIALATPAVAQSPILGLDSIDVISGWRQADGSHIAAVDIKLEKGWKTYWRVAGGGGVPPQFDWSRSENIARFEIKWPAPKVFYDYGQETIGYKDKFVLPIVFYPIDATKPMNLDGTMDFGVCENVCVPVRSNLSARLPARVTVGKSTIQTALKKQAISGKAAGVTVTNCAFQPIKGGFEIQADLKSNKNFHAKAIGVVEYPSGSDDWLQQQPSKVSQNQLTANAILYAKDVAFIDRSKLRVTVLQNGKAIELLGCS